MLNCIFKYVTLCIFLVQKILGFKLLGLKRKQCHCTAQSQCSSSAQYFSSTWKSRPQVQSSATDYSFTSPLRTHSLTTLNLAGINTCVFYTFYVTALVKSIQSFLWHPSQLIWRHKFIRAQCPSNKKVSAPVAFTASSLFLQDMNFSTACEKL